jgi:hypothetical protein
MSIFNNNKFDPFGTNSLFSDINKTNQLINSMNLPVQPTPQEQDFKRQRYGNMMLALSDVLKGRDPSAGVMQRQALIEAQKKEAERKRKMAQYKENNPGMVGMLEALEAGVPASLLSNKDSLPASVKEYQFAKQQGYKGSYQDFLQSKKQSTNINLNQGNLNKLGQELAADDYKQSRIKADDARAVLTNVDTLENLLNQGVNTGFGANLGLGLQRIGQSIIGEDYKVPEIAGREAFQAASTQLILPLVKQLGVNPTDKDLDFVRTGSAELGKSETGNKLMLAALRLSANRRVDEQIFNQNFYAQPENQNATIYQRDIAFEEHKRNNPELYTSITLQQAYDNLLLNQANNSSVITTDETAPFGN